MFRFGFSVVCLSLCVTSLPAKADLLGLSLVDYPDIASGFIDVSYDAGLDEFTADGFAVTFNDDGVGAPVGIVAGTFFISASIDEDGNPVSGVLSIDGNVLGFGPNLLTGTLSEFGFGNPPGGNIFEFLFDVDGGDLATSDFYGVPGSGAQVGVILDANGGGFDGTFDVSFDNYGGVPGTGNGVADTAPLVPEPASLLLILAVGAFVRRRDAKL